MLTVQISTKPYGDEKIYAKNEHIFNDGITILVGKNGAGKSTLLRSLKEECKKDKIPMFFYDNYVEGGSRAKSKYSFYQDFTMLSTAMCSSEGQQIYMNLGYMMPALRKFIADNKGAEKVVLAFDALDSGLDLSNIAEIRGVLQMAMEDIQKNGTEVYILITANSYGFVKNSRCYDVAHNKEVSFNSYEEYEKFIFKQAAGRNKNNADD